MKEKIAIEPALTPIKDFLSNKGYDVKSVEFGNIPSMEKNNYDAFIVTGMNKDFIGMNDTGTNAIVIDAKGMTPEEVYHELQMRF